MRNHHCPKDVPTGKQHTKPVKHPHSSPGKEPPSSVARLGMHMQGAHHLQIKPRVDDEAGKEDHGGINTKPPHILRNQYMNSTGNYADWGRTRPNH